MNFIGEVVIAVLVVSAVIALIWTAVGIVLTPVRCGRGGSMCTVLRITGNFPELEQAVKGILWLKKSGIMDTEIIIADWGMDEETRQIAELMCEKYGKIVICDSKELERVISEEV